MKKIILSIALVTGLTNAYVAQDNSATAATPKKEKGQPNKNATPEERAKKGADHAEKKLGLTADQKAKWEAAALERIKANEPHKEKMKGSTTPAERKDIHTAVKANNDKFDATVNAMLTPEQKAKFENEKKERKAKQMAKMKAKKGPGSSEPEIDLED